MTRILIAEDDESTRELLKFIVSSAGFEVETAADGQKALDAILQSPPDLAMLDIMLPEVHGFSICHTIKSSEALKGIKVLMLSAKAFPADRRQAENVGADAFLSKPVNPSELVETLQKLLKK
jgi:twitching motility two-component system response regulator PilH